MSIPEEDRIYFTCSDAQLKVIVRECLKRGMDIQHNLKDKSLVEVLTAFEGISHTMFTEMRTYLMNSKP